MKRPLFFLLVCIVGFNQCYAQTIKFELYLFDQCADSVGRIGFFTLTKGDSTYYPKNNSGIVYLPEIGTYRLSSIYSDDYMDYHFTGFKSVVDTINSARIQLCLKPATTHPDYIGYCCCSEKCEGEQAEYYSNGNKRIEGCFKEGIPQGDLKIYFPSGDLKQVDKYNKKGHLKKRILYDESGKVKSSETY